jgi:serine/threonine protein kinase
MTSPTENSRVVKELFEAALQEAPARRPSFLQERCHDAGVRAEVEKLLARYEQDETALPRPGLETLDPGEAPGVQSQKIDKYHLIERIGQGGMGEVWLAEQREPVHHKVAIKLIKPGMDTREVVARFASERQALALMDHPAIAKVFDAGSTPEGRPYFAMEYVQGTPITTYCDRHKLTTRQRMELFIQVCEGVQHAHQKAIIHRDLKPSNILVSEVDGKPMARIIDFGLAKAIGHRLTGGSLHTHVGAILGTLEYMSPEQADSGGEDIDTRSDVYSLGVVLYQLLAGALPLDLKKMAGEQILRMIREQDAPPPSSRVLTEGSDSAITARNRSTDLPSLTRQLRGDPDAVVLKALEKDRKRRYASPSDLAADIERYLRNEPVSAHPPSAIYRGQKYIRRHRFGVIVAAAALMFLIGFAITESIQGNRIANAKKLADQNLKLAERAVDESLSSAGAQQSKEAPESPETEELRKQLLEKAKTFYKGFTDAEPHSEDSKADMAMAYLRLGDIYRLSQSNQDAVNDYNEAIREFEDLSKGHPADLSYLQSLGYCHNWIGETLRIWLESPQKPAQFTATDAQKEYDQAIAIQQELRKDAPANRDYQQDLARSYYNRGLLRYDNQGDPESDDRLAVELLKPLVEAASSMPEQTSSGAEAVREPLPEQDLARVYNNLGLYLDRLEQPEQSVQSLQESTKIVDKLLQRDGSNYEYKIEAASYYNNLAREFEIEYRNKQPKMVSDREQARMASDRARELGVDLSKLSPDLEKLLDKISKISDWIKTP